MTAPIKGYIHSFESLGTLDGPGIREIIFFGGCSLRCQYCHNADMFTTEGSTPYFADDVVKKVLKNKPYFDESGGGITISGGDPFFQPAFLLDLLKKAKAAGLHTVVDTGLFTKPAVLKKAMPFVDLFMVSLKHFDNEEHIKLTGKPNKQILKNIQILSDSKHPLWFRYVVLPGLTDVEDNLNALVEFLGRMNFEKIELLPYHTMGVDKWAEIDMPYTLKTAKPPTKRKVSSIKKFLVERGIPAEKIS
jgi:pyruvate formate lyase activating enzyme